MIKIQYPNNIENLKSEYLKIFNISELQEKAKYILQGLSIPNVKDLLTADFRQLVEICQKYKKMKKTKEESEDLLNNVFKYKTYYSDIAVFFVESLNISTCYYCEMSYVNSFTNIENGKTKRQFDLDHIIPKSDYPIVALSLFNFVPSCKVCNSKTIKGAREYIDITNSEEAVKLSPSSNEYNFENEVNIAAISKSGSTFFLKDKESCYIEFQTSNPTYQKEIQFFHLNERYDYHKILALRLLEKQAQYPDSNIQKISEIIGKSPEDIREAIFNEQFINEHHRTFSKMYKDIMAIYGKPPSFALSS